MSFDLANTQLNFKLDVTRAVLPTTNPLILNRSAADLFEIQEITINGVRINHARQSQGD